VARMTSHGSHQGMRGGIVDVNDVAVVRRTRGRGQVEGHDLTVTNKKSMDLLIIPVGDFIPAVKMVIVFIFISRLRDFNRWNHVLGSVS
jgi:hypothetical protein